MKVVLPAPLGPIRACTSPSAMSRSTACRASSAPKRRLSWRTLSRASLMAGSAQGGDAAWREEHDAEQQQTEAQMPVQGEAGENFFQPEQDEGTQAPAVEIAGAANDHHHQQAARLRPLQEAGAGQ